MDFRELVVWQKAMDLAQQIYCLTAKFPDVERFGLVTQLRRAAVSIPSNIAEGHGTGSTRNCIRDLSTVPGPSSELWTQTTLSGRLQFLAPDDAKSVLAHCEEVAKMTNALRTTLQKGAKTTTRPCCTIRTP